MKKVSKILFVLAVLFVSLTFTNCTELEDNESIFETQTIDPCDVGTPAERAACREAQEDFEIGG